MVNYGYAPTKKDAALARALRTYVNGLPPDERGHVPRVEQNGLYPGVRVRGLTHRTDIDAVVAACDAIYIAVVEKGRVP